MEPADQLLSHFSSELNCAAVISSPNHEPNALASGTCRMDCIAPLNSR